MKRIGILIACIIFLGFKSNNAYACHGMPLVAYGFTVGATGVTVKASSDMSTCGCGPYWLQVEVACAPTAFTSTMVSCLTNTLMNWNNPNKTYTSYPFYNALLNVPNYSVTTGWPDNCVVEPYNTVFIPFSQFCPGSTMYFRSREVVAGAGPGLGPWTAVNSFVVPGTVTTPTCSPNLSHSPPTTPASMACPGSPFNLTINNLNCLTTCGGTMAPSCVPTTTVFYKWRSTPNSVVTPTITSLPSLFVPYLNSTTTFSVWAIDSCNVPGGCAKQSLCVNTNTIWPLTTTIFINSVMPLASFTASPNQCLTGNNFNFNATTTPGSTYSWNYGDGNTGTGANVNHTYATAGTFTVSLTVTTPGACAPATVTKTVTVFPMPTVTAGNSGPVCAGLPLNLTSGGAVNYSWSGPSGFSSALQNPSIAVPVLGNAGVYTVTGTDANGCSASATTTVVINPGPSLTVNNTGPICSGNSISMSVSGATTYTWSGPNSFSSNSSNPTITNASASASGVYTVNALTSGGCISTATTLVIVNPTPTITITNSGPVCAGSSLTISATGGGTYSWLSSNGLASTQGTIVIGSATGQDGGIYTLTVTSTEGCVSTATTVVVVNPTPTCSAVANTPLCEGEDLTFTTTQIGGNSFTWNGPNGFVSSQKNPKINDALMTNNGAYTLTVTSDKNCSSKLQVNVVVNPTPNVSIVSKNTVGCAPLCNVSFTANSTSPNITNYEWNLGNGTSANQASINDVCFYSGGAYTPSVTVTDNNNCKNTASTPVQVHPKPVADYNYSPNPININNPVVTFSDHSFGGDINSWLWTFYPATIDQSYLQNPNVTFKDTGVYNVFLVVTNTFGCKDTAAKAIYVYEDFMFYVPNAFTPNGDGQNDEFRPIITNISSFSMSIFDRWGKEVFSTKDINKGWDGVVKSKINNNATTKQEVYIWRIEYKITNGKSGVHTGHVTLIK